MSTTKPRVHTPAVVTIDVVVPGSGPGPLSRERTPPAWIAAALEQYAEDIEGVAVSYEHGIVDDEGRVIAWVRAEHASCTVRLGPDDGPITVHVEAVPAREEVDADTDAAAHAALADALAFGIESDNQMWEDALLAADAEHSAHWRE
jgi:hypothetical protein